jgi:tetratricopeptide (TPR) repeat protein
MKRAFFSFRARERLKYRRVFVLVVQRGRPMPKPAAEAVPNELLLYERRKRRWTRDDVVENILNIDNTVTMDANTVGRWERGITEPVAHHLRLLTMLYQRSIEELGYVSEDRIPFWNIDGVSLPNSFFTGREDFFKKLHAVPALRDEHRKQCPHKLPLQQLPQTLTGLGGIGKTQIALEYAYRYMHDYHTIVWVRANSLQTMRSDFASMATLLNLPEKQQPEQDQIIAAVKQWFTNMTRWLLIFDDADNPESIYHFIPSTCYGHILITTRSQSHVPEIGAQSIDVDEMTQEEAMDFLLQRARIIERASSHTSALQADQTLARTITETLGRLPLALDQAGAYIQRTQCGLSRYYDSYQKKHEKLLHYRGASRAYLHSVASTWSLNFEKVREANLVAIDLLYLLAFLNPDAIPEAILIESAAQPETALAAIASDLTSLDLATEELLRYSLVRRNPDARTYAIHPLVQTVVKDQMPEDTRRQWADRAVQAVNRVFPDVKFTTWPLCERYLSHAQTCVSHIAQWDMKSAEAARLLDQPGMYLLQHGRYSDAEELLQRGLKMREQLFGPQHLEVARSLANLGLLYYYQYQDAQAEPLYQRALAINEQLLGATHPTLIGILHYLGDLYYNQDKYTEAEFYYRRAWTILERTPEAEPGDLAMNLSGLGLTYYKQKKYAEAESLLNQALEIYTEAFDAGHPDVATQLTNLARLYHDQGKNTEAELLFQRALTIREHALGPSALAVANSLHFLAKFYRDQGNHAEAEPLLNRAVKIVKQGLAPSNPLRAEIMRDYSDLLQKMGQVARARRLISREK